MSVDIKKMAGFLGGRDFMIFLALSFAGYALLEKVGLFGLFPASWREILHSPFSKSWSILFSLNAILGMRSLFSSGQGGRRAGRILLYLAVIVTVAALWVSINTRFEGRAVRAETQTFGAFKADYIQQSLSMARFSSLPQVGITIHKLHPEPYAGMMKMKKVTAEITYAGRTTGGLINGSLSSSWPLISDWTFVSITDFGYTPKYVLSDLKGDVLESKPLNMRLFPPGSEGSFEAMFLGYKFYLKLYPDYADREGGPTTLSASPNNPVYNLRIVRNKDIVYNGLLKPTEKLRFDNFIISVPEVRMWVEMSFVRDFGLFFLPLTLLLFITGAGLTAAGK